MFTPEAEITKEHPSQRLLGTWKMRSWSIEDLASGERHDALGPEPRGYLTYGSDGRVMVLVTAGHRTAPAALVPTAEEKIALYDSMFAYAGTFTFDGVKVIHHIDTPWNETWRGTHQVRFVEARGDTLTYVSAPGRSPMTGLDCVHTVVFERLESSGRSWTSAGSAPAAAPA